MRKFLALLLTCCMLIGLLAACGSTGSSPTAPTDTAPQDIAILYTNDVHTYIDKPLSYDVLSALKTQLKKQYAHVILADCGDAVQGTAYGSMDKGKTVIELMNATGYDVATLGNHEFDYGMDGCMNVIDWARFPYTSCNFYHEQDGVKGEAVLEPYVLFPCGKETLAFVGITTPESFTKSTPAYFQDETGNYIYGISGGEDGKALYADVQTAINNAKAAGATKVIALGHLGDDGASQPWTSLETIANVSGLTAFIDGHSHTTVEGKQVTDKDGKAVLLTQTGEYFDAIGLMVIDGQTGAVTTDLIRCEDILQEKVDEQGEPVLDEDGKPVMEVIGHNLLSDLYTDPAWISDDAVAASKNQWMTVLDAKLGTKIGSVLVSLGNYDKEGNRLVRSQETNAGDFTADALYYLFDNMGLNVDVAVMNGGGIRNKTPIIGKISYKTAKDIHTFGNMACLQTVTGQQLLDALEWGARSAGTGEENGSFLQVAGITYQIDTQWPDSTNEDDKGVWLSGPTGGYRVHNVQVYNKETNAYEPLVLTDTYDLAGYNYTLRDLGGGFNMFSGAVNVVDYVMEDYMVLAHYIQGFEGGVVDGKNSPLLTKYPAMKLDYTRVNGSGRITFGEAAR